MVVGVMVVEVMGLGLKRWNGVGTSHSPLLIVHLPPLRQNHRVTAPLLHGALSQVHQLLVRQTDALHTTCLTCSGIGAQVHVEACWTNHLGFDLYIQAQV